MTVADSIPADAGAPIAAALVAAVRAHAAELSTIDGAIGDGDHGVNLSKGFGIAAEHLGSREVSVSEALQTIGDTLLVHVGGAIGPLYGTFFLKMAAASAGLERIDSATVERMLDAGVDAVLDLGGARVGDKTLVDVLIPARTAFRDARAAGANLDAALAAMAGAAERGRESTRNLVARVGRASRLGERSRGVLDPGAASCALLLGTFAGAFRALTPIARSGTGANRPRMRADASPAYRSGYRLISTLPGDAPHGTEVFDLRPATHQASGPAAASVVPGVMLAVALAIPAWLGELAIPALPGVVLALVFGVIVRHLRPAIAPTIGPGVKYVLRWVLRSAIVLLGATLSFQAVLATGSSTLVIILICVALALGLAFALGRAVGVSTRTAALIGAGTAICGATAIVTVGPLIRASDDETAYAIATIFAFNVIAIVMYPVIGHALNLGPLAFGTWAGTAVNDTSAVVATGFLFSSAAAATATIVKLTRTVLLVPLAVAYAVGAALRDGSTGDRPSLHRLVLAAMPWFVLMFVALAVANTVGWIPVDLARAATAASKFLIVVVLAAVGLNISIPALARRGPRPMALGFAVAGLLSLASLVLINVAGLT